MKGATDPASAGRPSRPSQRYCAPQVAGTTPDRALTATAKDTEGNHHRQRFARPDEVRHERVTSAPFERCSTPTSGGTSPDDSFPCKRGEKQPALDRRTLVVGDRCILNSLTCSVMATSVRPCSTDEDRRCQGAASISGPSRGPEVRDQDHDAGSTWSRLPGRVFAPALLQSISRGWSTRSAMGWTPTPPRGQRDRRIRQAGGNPKLALCVPFARQ